MAKQRPNFNRVVRALLKDVAKAVPELRHIKPSRIIVVAGEARRASRATIKPLAFAEGKTRDAFGHRKPVVKVRGKRILYCVTLRPLFFRASTPADRIGTLLHELYHVSPSMDGTLDPERRHAHSGRKFNRKLRPLVRRYLRSCPPALLQDFALNGEVRVWQWLERPSAFYVPGTARARRLYTEEQLFLGLIRMKTPRPLRTVKP